MSRSADERGGDMSENVESLRKEFERRSTDELISILRNRDEEEWRPEVFAVVATELEGRGVSLEEVAAMGPEGIDVVEAEPTVTVATFFSPAEGHASRMALEEAGIAAWVMDEAGGFIRLKPKRGVRNSAQESLLSLFADSG